MKNIFYTYIYLDTKKPGNYCYENYSFNYEPIYVGKGHNNRWKDHLGYYKNWLGYKIRHIMEAGLEPKVVFIGKDLEEQSAFKLEIELIKIIGRRDLKTGPLVNLTDGGDGGSGYIHTKRFKKKMSERMKKNNPMKNSESRKKHLERSRELDFRKRISEGNKRRWEDPKARRKMSINNPMKNLENVKKNIESRKKFFIKNPNASSDWMRKMNKEHPEVIKKLIDGGKKYWKDNQDAREKQSNRMRKNNPMKDLKVRKKNAKSQRKVFENPKMREAARDKAIEQWKKPGAKERMLSSNNPMSNPETKKKALETRRRNRELRKNK